MNLDDTQKKKVAEWIAQGLKLSEIQKRLDAELGARLTYMEVRLLVDDLKLTPKDVEPAKPAASALTGSANRSTPAAAAPPAPAPSGAPGTGKVSITVDQLTRPGAVVSGKVTFSDGNQAEWYFDQTGRLALAAQRPGYRPSPGDLQQFQTALDTELSKLGF
jgi:hypothetical protein